MQPLAWRKRNMVTARNVARYRVVSCR